ncbi:hypothetical protein ACF0H5_017594 [Mactra antiquata]
MATAGRSETKKSEKSFDFICTLCDGENKTVEGVIYCVECSGYCCQSCTDTHKKFPTLRNHNLLDVSQRNQAGNQQPKLPELPERCGTHHGKPLTTYCEKHMVNRCRVCISKDHSKPTESRLRDTIYSMSSLYDSKDTQLATLVEAKNEALQKITKIQKVLKAAITKATEISKEELENTYIELEDEILQDQSNIKKIIDDLQSTNDKFIKTDRNMAQHFQCIDLAEEQIKEADDLMHQQKMNADIYVHLSFTPSQSLIDNINGLNGIGEVIRRTKKRTNLYKVLGSSDINIKLIDDSEECQSHGCCLTLDNNHLLLTDYNNKKLKCFDIDMMMMVDYCTLDGSPFGVCCTSTDEAVVACGNANMIQFVSIDEEMSPTKQIPMSHVCYGIATKDDKLYITDSASALYMYDMTGNLLKTVSQDSTGNKLFYHSRHVTFNESGKNMYVGNVYKNIVCFDYALNYLSTYKDNRLSSTNGVCVDGKGSIFVVGWGSDHVVQLNECGTRIGTVTRRQDELTHTQSVCFHRKLNILFVTMVSSDVVKMYELGCTP